MSILKKIINSFFDGTFFKKLKRRTDNWYRIYFVKNKNIRFDIAKEKTSNKVRKKYKKFIQEEIECGLPEKSNKVWVLWFQGYSNAPDLVKACINSVKNTFYDKDVIVLHNNNLYEYIELPEYIVEKYKKGIIGNAHYSDIIRIELLSKYGGLWLDATVLCTEYPKYPINFFERKLFVYKDMDLTRADKCSTVCSNWMIYAWKNNKIVLLVRKLLFEYWKSTNKVDNYFIFHILWTLATERYSEEWNEVPMFNNRSPHTLQFELNNSFDNNRWDEINSINCFHKLSHHSKEFKENSFYEFIIKKYGKN